MVAFYQNSAGSVTVTRSDGVVKSDDLPDEAPSSGAPRLIQAGDTITFNNLAAESSSLTGVGDNVLSEIDSSRSTTSTYLDGGVHGYPAGTEINTGYALTLQDSAGSTYIVHAVSTGFNNDDGGYDATDLYVFEGEIPPQGEALTVIGITWASSVDYASLAEAPATSVEPGPTEPGPTEPGPVCFAAGTLIRTETGLQRIEAIGVGDIVICYRSGHPEPKPVRWRGSRVVKGDELAENPKLRPVRVMAGALGCGLPERDLLVSRQHRLLVSSLIVTRMTGQTEALVPAIALTVLPGVFVDNSVDRVEYCHLLFEEHEIVHAEGVKSESLYPGPRVMNAMSEDAREEIFIMFPELKDQSHQPEPARSIISGARGRRLIRRHLNNSKQLLEGRPGVLNRVDRG